MSKIRVLVVEDERIVALHLRQRLTKLGYDIAAVATSGEKALMEIERSAPDVVLMDIHIEGDIDGIQTASRIPAHLNLPVIYLTAYSEEATLERARTTKPYGFLLKPFSERELHATIQMVLERRRADVLLRESEQQLELLVAQRTGELVAANAQLQEQVAQRQRAEQALHQAQKMEAIGQLTGGIAHDFNNLLTVVGGSLDMIQRETGDRDKVARHAATASRAVERCERLIKQLLMFARRQVMRPETLDPNRLIAEFAPLTHAMNGGNIELVMHLSPVLGACRMDQTQFERAILNLVMNARDALDGQGRITIETATVELALGELDSPDMIPGTYVMVSVTDDGRGIPADVLPRIFDPFFTTKGAGKGSGLGLSQVYGFAKESGGQVRISSEPGRGTTVRLYLPCSAEVAVSPATPSNALPPDGLGHGRETVLVVEDDPQVLEFAVESIKDLGYLVLTAHNADRALDILRRDETIGILFSDVIMPGGMNGVQLAVEARRLRPTLKVVLTSGYTGIALAEHGLEKDIPLLEKPYRPQDLAARFRRVSGSTAAR